jgi:hypothetical protein
LTEAGFAATLIPVDVERGYEPVTKPKVEVKRYKQPPVPGGRPYRVRVQLTDTEYQALQQVSKQRGIGIPQLLTEAYFQPAKLDPRALMRELAGVRRILTDEREQLIKLTQRQPVEAGIWDQVTDVLDWRNLQLTELYRW